MRVLVISDVHGNLAALEAVLAQPHDALVCLGDLVGYGPEPGACVRRIREAGLVLQGNHDRALGEDVAPGCSPRFEWLARALDPVGRAQLDPEERAWLAGLPRTATREYDGHRCFLVHATPGDPLYRYLGPDAPEWAVEVAGLDVDGVLAGHTHVPFELTAAGRRVINPGSVGQPKDGDPPRGLRRPGERGRPAGAGPVRRGAHRGRARPHRRRFLSGRRAGRAPPDRPVAALTRGGAAR